MKFHDQGLIPLQTSSPFFALKKFRGVLRRVFFVANFCCKKSTSLKNQSFWSSIVVSFTLYFMDFNFSLLQVGQLLAEVELDLRSGLPRHQRKWGIGEKTKEYAEPKILFFYF